MKAAAMDKTPTSAAASIPTKKKVVRNRRQPVQRWRFIIQSAFAALCVWIGVEFYFFVKAIERADATAMISRPPGVDGFLPISSLMSLYYWFLSGAVHPYHPAGLVIISAIILMSLLFGKSFCSWLCPVGFLSEVLGDLGQKLFGRTLHVPRWLDWPLRSLKYLLLGFFVYSIFFLMNEFALRQFLDSPYNLVADVKMYYFFAEISRTALIVIGALLLLSVVIRNFWCRYLCPYGALLGITSLLSPFKIKRNPVSCIDCAKCAIACPSRIQVDKVKTVISDECTSCMHCVDVCPVADTLDLKSTVSRHIVSPKAVAIGVVVVFMLVTGIGMLTGYWQNDVPMKTYIDNRDAIHNFSHPTSTSDIRKLRDSKPTKTPAK